MDAVRLTDHLCRNADAVILLLEALGFDRINHNRFQNKVRFAREEGRNPSSVSLDLGTLFYKCFSTNERGDIFTLIMRKRNINFAQALDFVASTLGLEKERYNHKTKPLFGGRFRGLIKAKNQPESAMPVYNESILEPYSHRCNLMFLRDGISFDVQERFKIGYDYETNRITIPIYTLDNKLCGIMGRLNDPDCPKEERYLPLIPCSRSLTVYGYVANYMSIQQEGRCIITEAEKGVMQLASFGYNFGLSTSGCTISDVQRRYIKCLRAPKIILAYDEGLAEHNMREEAKKLVSDNTLLKNQVGYIYDRQNEILKRGSKNSPSDMGKTGFEALLNNHVTWL